MENTDIPLFVPPPPPKKDYEDLYLRILASQRNFTKTETERITANAEKSLNQLLLGLTDLLEDIQRLAEDVQNQGSKSPLQLLQQKIRYQLQLHSVTLISPLS